MSRLGESTSSMVPFVWEPAISVAIMRKGRRVKDKTSTNGLQRGRKSYVGVETI